MFVYLFNKPFKTHMNPMRKKRLPKTNTLVLWLVLLATSTLSAQTDRTSSLEPILSSSKQIGNSATVTTLPERGEATVFITHSQSQAITIDNTIACTHYQGGPTTANSFVRDFNLARDFGITENFQVTSVEFGVELVTGPRQIILAIYSANGDLPNGANSLVLHREITYTSTAADQGKIISVPLNATIPAGKVMVFEVYIGPDESTNWYLGSNQLGETGISWLQANECGIEHLTNANTLMSGVLNHYVMNVVGETPLSVADNNLLTQSSLYPNPMNGDSFYINAPQLNGEKINVSITDMSGRLISNNDLDCLSNQIYVPIDRTMASGIYLVTLKYQGQEHTLRLIKD